MLHHKKTSISIYNLAAGIALDDVDTSTLAHPYADAIAKPVHSVKHWSKFGFNFTTAISGNPDVSFRCISGKDGEHTDYRHIDNDDCVMPISSGL